MCTLWLAGCRPAPPLPAQVHPGSTYEVNLGSVWSGIGLLESNILNA